jgi:putative membrane protein
VKKRYSGLFALILYAVLWVGGLLSSVLWDQVPDNTTWAAPVFLYLASILILIYSGTRPALLLFAVGVYGFVIEVIGSASGFPFGDYEYTKTLGPALFDVPLALASAWIVVTAFTLFLLNVIKLDRRWWFLIGPLLMVTVDLLIEPVAAGPMNAWDWASSGEYYGVPVTNFFGWFLVSIPIFTIYSVVGSNPNRGSLISSSVIVFFIALSAINLLWWPILITLVAIAMLALPHLKKLFAEESADDADSTSLEI